MFTLIIDINALLLVTGIFVFYAPGYFGGCAVFLFSIECTTAIVAKLVEMSIVCVLKQIVH